MKPIKLHILLAEDSGVEMLVYRSLLTRLATDQSSEIRQRYLPECGEVEIALSYTCAVHPNQALECIRNEGARFDAVLSDGIGWLDFATEAATRFPVIGSTGDEEMVSAFQKVGITCYLKGGNDSTGEKDIAQVCANVIRAGLRLPIQ